MSHSVDVMERFRNKIIQIFNIITFSHMLRTASVIGLKYFNVASATSICLQF